MGQHNLSQFERDVTLVDTHYLKQFAVGNFLILSVYEEFYGETPPSDEYDRIVAKNRVITDELLERLEEDDYEEFAISIVVVQTKLFGPEGFFSGV